MKNLCIKTTSVRANGAYGLVEPKDGKHFTYEELQYYVGGKGKMIEIINFPCGCCSMVLDEEGKLVAEPKFNVTATRLWNAVFPIEKYPHNNDETVVGDVLFCKSSQIQ